MKKLVLSMLGAASLCAGPAFAQEAGNVNEGQPGPQYGTMEWIHRYGPNAYPAHPIYPGHPYAAPLPRDNRAAARRERELREREIALQRERDAAAAAAAQRDRELAAARRERERERGWDATGMRRDRDRDGDGIANRRDRHPDDPSRF